MRCIDGDALIEKAHHEAQCMSKPFKEQFGVLVEWLVEKTPTIDPETEEEAYERGYTAGQMAQRKPGRWIHAWGTDDGIWECSECGFKIDASGCVDPVEYLDTFKFCPNCGSDNREEGDRE